MKYKYIGATVFGSAALVTCALGVGDAESQTLPSTVVRTSAGAAFTTVGSVLQGLILSDSLYGFRNASAPVAYTDFENTCSVEVCPTLSINTKVCRQAYGGTVTCATASNTNVTQGNSADVYQSTTGVYATTNSPWDYYYFEIGGSDITSPYFKLIGGGAQMSCW
jgi:hypothetical protein